MFLFYHTQQDDKNKEYYKGTLFELLLKKYLSKGGYDIEIRRKRNSLEYDLIGEDRATNIKIIGEAKAHNKPITGQVFTSFVGKLLPEGLYEKEIKGLFLSISALTPEADDYYQKIKSKGVISRTGKELFDAIKKELEFYDDNHFKKILEMQNYIAVSDYILTTNNGDFQVYICRSNTSGTPSYFAIFNKDGSKIDDIKFLETLKANIEELEALVPITSGTIKSKSRATERTINEGLIVSTNWIDYKLPAGPKYFVGRDEIFNKIQASILDENAPRVLQIKSRSGVGKSSVLAFLYNSFTELNYKVELHDARDIKSVLDIYSIVQRFTKSDNIARDLKEVNEQLNQLIKTINGSKAVMMVDQFESTFPNPNIFDTYEFIANIILRLNGNIHFIIARKNDQLTTYDDTKISLDKINSYSQSYVLNDFSKEEAISLISKINEASSSQIRSDVLSYVLEFAQGFPWLLKRTMAHIIKLISSGISQGELFKTGLRLDDLFNEELEELDELERDYLRRIASRLPADFNQLQRQFDDDPFLPKILDKLTKGRLLRLSGSTYDTYNDVFKEYLKYQKLPEFRQPIIYRMHPNSVMASFHSLIKKGEFNIKDLQDSLKVSKGSAYNLARELGGLNLITGSDNDFTIPQTVRDVYKVGKLGEFIRRQLNSNDVVSNLISHITLNGKIHSDNLPDYLIEQFPFVDASEKTWKTYSNILKGWLLATKVLSLNEDGYLALPEEKRTVLIDQIGNLSELNISIKKQTFDFFMPTSPLNKIEEVLLKIKKGNWKFKGAQFKSLQDLRNAGFVVGKDLVVSSIAELREQSYQLITTENHMKIFNAAKNNEYLIPVAKEIFGNSYTEETLKWKIKTLLSWAKHLGIIENKNYKYVERKRYNTQINRTP